MYFGWFAWSQQPLMPFLIVLYQYVGQLCGGCWCHVMVQRFMSSNHLSHKIIFLSISIFLHVHAIPNIQWKLSLPHVIFTWFCSISVLCKLYFVCQDIPVLIYSYCSGLIHGHSCDCPRPINGILVIWAIKVIEISFILNGHH